MKLGIKVDIDAVISKLNSKKLLYIELILLLIIILYFSFVYPCIPFVKEPVEERSGNNNNSYSIPVDFYLLNTTKNPLNLNDRYAFSLLNDVNHIWNLYNITFFVNNVTLLSGNYDDIAYMNKTRVIIFELDDQNLTEYERKVTLLSENIIPVDRLYRTKENGNIIEVVIVKKLHNNYFEALTPNNRVNGTLLNLIIIDTASKNVSWNLAHEFGHLLNNNHEYCKYNLMIDLPSSIKYNYYPSTLNQTQINHVLGVAKSFDTIR